MSFLSFIKNSHFPISYNYRNKCIAMYLKHYIYPPLSFFAICIPPSISFEPRFTPVTGQTSSAPGFFHLWMTARFTQTSFPSPGPPSSPSLQVTKAGQAWGPMFSLHFCKKFSFKQLYSAAGFLLHANISWRPMRKRVPSIPHAVNGGSISC